MTPGGFDIQGHRGARGLFPENTIPGFVAALDLGIPTLEMDAVVSRDDHVVLSHEPWLARATTLRPDGSRIPPLREREHRIYDMLYEEIAAFDCGSLKSRRFPQQKCMPAVKPLLNEVIETCEQHAADTRRAAPFYSIETKSRPVWDGIYHPDPETFARLLLDVVEARGIAERAIVQSFDVRTLQSVKRMNPSVRLSLLVRKTNADAIDGNVADLGFTPNIYSPHQAAVDEPLVERTHGEGMQVVPWTVNEADRMVQLRDLGADGLITDYPDVAVRVLT